MAAATSGVSRLSAVAGNNNGDVGLQDSWPLLEYFRALSHQFYRTPEHHRFVRQQVVNQHSRMYKKQSASVHARAPKKVAMFGFSSRMLDTIYIMLDADNVVDLRELFIYLVDPQLYICPYQCKC
ncbi:hypothetical protein CFC21_065058 [Triticum aestivum]|uniref:Uncharacterized protein n=2 Tax=Triticum aestivum TaxID=4565 RepID=A0A3B6KD07_WHEAT|nr:hypothetical protein CFC21_065058 [Triticum aestivum]